MASSNCKRAMTGEQVLHAIDALSDSDNFEENDSDRDSLYNPSDNETADVADYSDSGLRQHIVRSLLMENSRGELPEADEMRPFYHHKSSDLSRLSSQHYMDLVPSTAYEANAARKCVQCAKHGIRKETRYICWTSMSQPALCVVPCFEKFHTVADN